MKRKHKKGRNAASTPFFGCDSSYIHFYWIIIIVWLGLCNADYKETFLFRRGDSAPLVHTTEKVSWSWWWLLVNDHEYDDDYHHHLCLSRSNKEGLKLSMAMIKMPTTGSSPVLAIHLAGRRQREGQQHRHLQVLLLMLMLGVLITKSVFSDSNNPSQIFWQCSFWSATTWEMMTKKPQTNPAFLHWFHPIQFWRLFVCNKCDFKVWTNNDDNGANQPDLGQLEEACERVSVMYI